MDNDTLKHSNLEHLYSDGDSGNSTAAAEEEEDGEYSLYSDVAELEYDYDEELYDEEEDNEPRSIPTDPIGFIIYCTSSCHHANISLFKSSCHHSTLRRNKNKKEYIYKVKY